MSKQRHTVTIGMRTCERPLLLRRAIRDVLDQSFRDWRLVILNNGGDRASLDSLVGEFAGELGDRAEVIHSERKLRPGAAVNSALPDPLGEFVVVHDDDDTWHETFLERAVRKFETVEDDVAAVGVRLDRVTERIVDNATVVEQEKVAFTPFLERVNFQSLLLSNPFPPIGLLVRAEVFREIGGYDEKLESAVDWLFLLRLLERYRVEIIRGVLANYHLRPDADGTYENIVADRERMRASNAAVLDRYYEGAMRDGRISAAEISLSTSVVDRQNNERLEEIVEHLQVLMELLPEAERRTRQVNSALAEHEETFEALWVLSKRVRALRSLLRRDEATA